MTFPRRDFLGLSKDECYAVHISQFVGLCSKMYSLLFDDVSEVTRAESKVAKGVKGCVIRTSLAFKDYMQCLHLDESMEHTLKTIRSVSHDVHTFEQSKVSLSPFDDKHYILDHVHSVPYGQVMIPVDN